MKFQTFKCICGFILITAEENPKCPDCKRKMILVVDEKEQKQIDNAIRPMLKAIAEGVDQ